MESKNVFINDKRHSKFDWDSIGDIKGGRGDMGEEMPVLVYRLMQYSLVDVLSNIHGLDTANDYFRQAGYLAGTELAKNLLDLQVDFSIFIANLRKVLQNLKVGVLRMEFYNPETGSIVLTISQDLDCSGLPVTYENVCVYDEGFISGILEVYTGKKYEVKEIDCWANGGRICRFKGIVIS